MSSGSKNGTQIYYPFLSKVGKRIPSRFPSGTPMEIDPEPFLIYLPVSPVKEPSSEVLCTEPLQREKLRS
jgi:hypothetical protein